MSCLSELLTSKQSGLRSKCDEQKNVVKQTDNYFLFCEVHVELSCLL